MASEIERIFEELNRPSAAKLKIALKKEGVAFATKDIDALTRADTGRQLLAPREQYKGKIVATDINERWAADLIDYTSNPSKKGGEKYILVAQDIFTRKLYARALLKNDPRTVAAAFKEIVQQAKDSPEELNTDKGGEFTGNAFQVALRDLKIRHRVKDPQDRNAIATVDIAIANLKKALFRTGDDGISNWAERLDKVVAGINKTPHDHLHGSAPNDVKDKPELQYFLKKEASQDLQHNADLIHKRADKLKDDGAFRVQENQGNFARGFKPRFTDKVHTIAAVEGATVIDQDGKSFPTKLIQSVPNTSQDATLSRFARGGSAATSERQRTLLMSHAQRLLRKITPGSTLRRIDALRFLGADFKRDAQLAKLNMKKALVNFVNLFPDKLKIDGDAVRSLEKDPRIDSSGQPLQRLRWKVKPLAEEHSASRGPIDAFVKK